MASLKIPLDDTVGALLVGTILSAIAYGVTCLQVFSYFTEHCRRDSHALKSLVATVWILDSTHVAIITHTVYYDTVTNFGNYEALEGLVWSQIIQVVIGALLTFLVHWFFAFRIYILGRKRLLAPIVIVALTMGQLGSAIGLAMEGLTNAAFSTHDALPYFIGGLVTTVSCDCAIAATMIYHLHNGRTMVPTTNRVIHNLVKYAISTCLLEALCSVPCLLIAITQVETLEFMPFYFILVRLYACSLLCSLNNRAHLRDMNCQVGAITMSAFQVAHTPLAEESAPKSSCEVTRSESNLEEPTTPFRVQSSSIPQKMIVDVIRVQETIV